MFDFIQYLIRFFLYVFIFFKIYCSDNFLDNKIYKSVAVYNLYNNLQKNTFQQFLNLLSLYQNRMENQTTASLLNLSQEKSYDQAQVTEIDYRKMVIDTSVHPFNGIGKIVTRFFDTKTKTFMDQSGTAFIVGINLIVTAAHILKFQGFKDLCDEIQFFPQQLLKEEQTSKTSKKGIKAKIVYIKQDFIDLSEQKQIKNMDFAFIQLQQNSIITQNQILPLEFSYQLKKQDLFMISGYGVSIHKNKQFFEQKVAELQRGNFLYYRHTTKGGNSGSPVLLKKEEDKYVVVGIHKGTKGTYNYCLLLKVLNSPQVNNSSIKFDSSLKSNDLEIALQKNWPETYISSYREKNKTFSEVKQQIQHLKQKLKKVEILQDETFQLGQQIQYYKGKFQKSNQQAQIFKVQISELKLENTKIGKQLKMAEQNLKDSASNIERLKSEFKIKKNQSQQLRKELNQMTKKMEIIPKYEKQLSVLLQEIVTLNYTVQDKTQELQKNKNKLQQIESINKNIIPLQQKITILLNKNSILQRQLQQKQQDLKILTKQNQTTKIEFQKFQKISEQQNRQNYEIKYRIQRLSQEKSQFNELIKGQKQLITEKQQRINHLLEENTSLKNDLMKNQLRIKPLEATITQLRSELQSERNKIFINDQQNNCFKQLKSLYECDNQNIQLDMKLKRANQNLKAKQKQFSESVRQTNELDEKLKRASDNLNVKQKELNQRSIQTSEYDQKLKKANSDLKIKQAQFVTINQKMRSLQVKINENSSQNSSNNYYSVLSPMSRNRNYSTSEFVFTPQIKSNSSQEWINRLFLSSNIMKQYKNGGLQLLNKWFPRPIKSIQHVFSASWYGFKMNKFYQICGSFQNLIIIARTDKGNVVGGYTPLSFNHPGKKWKSEYSEEGIIDYQNLSFLFSFSEKKKFPINKNRYAIKRYQEKDCINFMDTFSIADQSNNNNNSYFSLSQKNYNTSKYPDEGQNYQKITGDYSQYFSTYQWQVYQVTFE